MPQLIKSLQRRSLKCSCSPSKEPKETLGHGFGNLSCPSLADGAVPENTREDLATPAWR